GEAVEVAQDVELGPGDRRDDRNEDRDGDRPDTYRKALSGTGEARNPAGDVASAVVGDEEDHREHHRADDAHCVGAGTEFVGRALHIAVHCSQADPGTHGGEPTEEGGAPLESAVAVALSVEHLLPRGGAPRCRHDRRVLVWCIPFTSHLTAPAFPAASAGPGSRRSP